MKTTIKASNICVTPLKSCFRCGAEFSPLNGEKLCCSCRKTKVGTPNVTQRKLTFREKQLVQLVAQGKANKEIAFTLILTEGTIKEYLNRIFRKVEVGNRTELAIWALTHRSECSSFEGPTAFGHRSLVV